MSMTPYTDALNQTAVYWGSPTSDGITGRTFDAAIEVDVRWEERQELFIDSQGQERRSRAVVFIDHDMVLGGYLFLGDLDDLSSSEEADPFEIDEAYEILSYKKIPDLDGTGFVRQVWL